jgi:hypothetical protein
MGRSQQGHPPGSGFCRNLVVKKPRHRLKLKGVIPGGADQAWSRRPRPPTHRGDGGDDRGRCLSREKALPSYPHRRCHNHQTYLIDQSGPPLHGESSPSKPPDLDPRRLRRRARLVCRGIGITLESTAYFVPYAVLQRLAPRAGARWLVCTLCRGRGHPVEGGGAAQLVRAESEHNELRGTIFRG